MTVRPDGPGRSGPPLPWDGRPERADVVIMAGIAAYGILGLALIPVVPALLGPHPLILEVISGSTAAEVTAGALSRTGHVPFALALGAGLPGSMALDWVFWWAGHRWGDRSLHLLLGRQSGNARQEARAARFERLARRFGPVGIVVAYYLPLPNIFVYAVAGLGGMRLRTFLLLDLVGTLLWIALPVSLGYALGQRAIDVVHTIDHYSTIITIVLVALVVVVAVLRALPGPRRRDG